MLSSRSCRAAILVDLRAPLVVDEIELPLLDYGQVLVKVHFSGICGAQLNEIDGTKGPDPHLPHLLGHEGSGTVMETGPGVKTVAVGDHVVMHWRTGAGRESDTPSYRWGQKTLNAGWVTTFNECAVVSENRLTSIPRDFDRRLAPLFGCAMTTALGVVNNDAQIKVGQSVVILGLGGVGQCLVQAADLVSGHPIVAVDIVPDKVREAKRWGATHGVCARGSDSVVDQVRAVVGGAGADVVIDTTGTSSAIEAAYDLTRPDGRTILVGVPAVGDNVSIYTLPLHFDKVLTGSHGGSSRPDLEIPRYLRLYAAQKLRLEGLVTHEFDLARINDAIALVRSGIAGRVLVSM